MTKTAEIPASNPFTAAQVEAALCIWEWMLDHREASDWNDACAREDTPAQKDFVALWNGVGTSQMRDLAARVAPAVEALYTELCGEIGEDDLREVYSAYDWDFVPAVCMRMDWSGDMTAACYRGGPIALPATCKPAMVAEFNEQKPKLEAVRARNAFMVKARNAAGRLWGYPGLVDDAPTTFHAAFTRGDDPEAFVRAIGEELDLSTPDPITQEELNRQYPSRG